MGGAPLRERAGISGLRTVQLLRNSGAVRADPLADSSSRGTLPAGGSFPRGGARPSVLIAITYFSMGTSTPGLITLSTGLESSPVDEGGGGI